MFASLPVPTTHFLSFQLKRFFSASSGTCDCERASFYDRHHDHIITGDLRLIPGTKLKFLKQGSPTLSIIVHVKLLLTQALMAA